jgi:HK97 gp10 family phage protein
MNDEAVRNLSTGQGVGLVTRALLRAGELVLQDAKRRCPTSPRGSVDEHGISHPSGHLRSSITGELVGRGGGMAVHVGTTVSYALFVEFGTKPHVIRPKDPNGVLHWRDRNGDHYAKEVHHPGTTAQPFLIPALDALANRVIQGGS